MKKHFIIILIIVLFSIFIPFSYAIYKVKSTGFATVKGAIWSVDFVSNDDKIDLTSGNTEQKYILTINNNSEVDVSYSVKLINLPSGVKVKIDDNGYIQENNNEILFSNIGTINYGESSKNHTLTFTSLIDAEEVTNQVFKIDVIFKQKVN